MLYRDSNIDIYSEYRLKYNDIIKQIFIETVIEKEGKNMAKDTRSEKGYSQGVVNITEI